MNPANLVDPRGPHWPGLAADTFSTMATALMEPSAPRLVLRQWRDADRQPFAALNADPLVMEHLLAELTRAQSDAMVDRCIEQIDRDGYGLWAVEVRTSGEFIGFVGLAAPTWEATFTPCTEIGWRLARSAWGHGYATEAANAALAMAFGPVGLHEVVSFTTTGNMRSQHVMQRIGMTCDPSEDFDHPRVPAGPLRRHVLYRISRTNWERRVPTANQRPHHP
jgi:RimJ/RimL family protein N-acetyltransferase